VLFAEEGKGALVDEEEELKCDDVEREEEEEAGSKWAVVSSEFG